MRSGQLRHVLIIERPTNVKGSMGGSSQTWATFATVRGGLDFSGSRQVLAEQQINGEIIGMATIRYMEGITADMRINHEGNYYNISKPFSPDGKNRELKIPFTKGLSDG